MSVNRTHVIGIVSVLVLGALAIGITMNSGGGDNGSDGAQAGGRGGPGGRMGGGQATQIVAEPATLREFSTRVEALGTLEPRERVNLVANASDRVTGVYFEDGQRVRRGDTLIVLANNEEQAQMESALATVEEARRDLARNEKLAEDGAVSTSALQRSQRDAENASAQVRTIQARLGDRVLRAPFDGVLGFRMVSPGAYVSPGQQIATLIDDSEMRLEFAVPSIFAGNLKSGLRIEAHTDDISDRSFVGSVTSVNNSIDPVTRSVKVRATLPNEEGALKAGMFMTVNLSSDPRKSLHVSEISIIAEGPDTFVYVVDESQNPSTVMKRKVELGVRERGYVEVTSGLDEGDMVVTEGILKLRPNAPVSIVPPLNATPAALAGEVSPTMQGGGPGPTGLER